MSHPHSSNVIWTSPSRDSSGSMPLGNGDISLNAWLEPSGDLLFYIGKSDSWGEFGQLYKVGRLRVSLSADNVPILTGARIWIELDLPSATLHVQSDRAEASLWVDANNPCFHIRAKGPENLQGQALVEIWRTEARELKGGERHGLHKEAPYPVRHEADTLLDRSSELLSWCHHNRSSSWSNGLKQQGLGDLASEESDPLLGNTFGCVLSGPNLQRTDNACLQTQKKSSQFSLTGTLLTMKADSPESWYSAAANLHAQMPQACDESAYVSHSNWWKAFWDRSSIRANGSEAARKATQGYDLQRYMNACAGRGQHPIKFNGSLFTVDWNLPDERFDADYRRWGPGYWHQNTRLPYWSMLYAGDFDMMRPYFAMYRQALPLARERCERYCGHPGAFFPETMYFWGSYLEHDYGWEREEGLGKHRPQNQYIRRHNSSGLEVCYHALLFHAYTGDDDFLVNTALPLLEAILAYYDHHFSRRNGRLHIHPAQVIEQWWIAENPMPEIAGLKACLKLALKLPESLSRKRSEWMRLQSELPPLPIDSNGELSKYLPAESWFEEARNMENPELYCVFPYHHCGVHSDCVDIGRNTFRARRYKHDMGWAQDGMQAALLGIRNEARDSILKRLTTGSPYARFPAFWGPSFDWVPDQDQGGSASHAFQLMCLQNHENKAYLLPAWEPSWDVEFQLRGPKRSQISCHYRSGSLQSAEVNSESASKTQLIDASQPSGE